MRKLLLLILLLSSISVYASLTTSHDVRYSRSDCIVLVELRAVPLGINYWKKLTLNVNKTIVSMSFHQKYKSVVVISIPFSSNSNKRAMYIQYMDRCADKLVTTEKLMVYLKDKINGFPNYKIVHKKIMPNPHTIDTCGRFWKDCHN